ncbi:hypothetical protein V8C40DRAFT_3452 [Trichoderma camerunense]
MKLFLRVRATPHRAFLLMVTTLEAIRWRQPGIYLRWLVSIFSLRGRSTAGFCFFEPGRLHPGQGDERDPLLDCRLSPIHCSISFVPLPIGTRGRLSSSKTMNMVQGGSV